MVVQWAALSGPFFCRGLFLMSNKAQQIFTRLIAVLLIVLLLGFYPGYLHVMHALCGIVQGHPIRYL